MADCHILHAHTLGQSHPSSLVYRRGVRSACFLLSQRGPWPLSFLSLEDLTGPARRWCHIEVQQELLLWWHIPPCSKRVSDSLSKHSDFWPQKQGVIQDPLRCPHPRMLTALTERCTVLAQSLLTSLWYSTPLRASHSTHLVWVPWQWLFLCIV
jgi:hypothetical protein